MHAAQAVYKLIEHWPEEGLLILVHAFYLSTFVLVVVGVGGYELEHVSIFTMFQPHEVTLLLYSFDDDCLILLKWVDLDDVRMAFQDAGHVELVLSTAELVLVLEWLEDFDALFNIMWDWFYCEQFGLKAFTNLFQSLNFIILICVYILITLTVFWII